MKLIELSESDKQQYNRFVMKNESGSFLQAWEWGEWQENLGKQVRRFFLANDDNHTAENSGIIAAIQLIKMPLLGGKHYWYAPYGPVVDVRYKMEDVRYMVGELQKKFLDAVFFRIEPIDKSIFDGNPSWAVKSTNIQPAITIVVDVNKSDEELLSAMHPKTRYNIKVAERHGVEIQYGLDVTPRTGLQVSEAINLILQTQIRQRYRGHSADYYGKFLDFFTLHHPEGSIKVRIYKALYEKKLLTCGVMVDFGPTRMYLFGGSSEEHRNLMAPYLLHAKAMQDARKAGLLYYDLGGSEVASGGEKGFTRFKKGFGGRVVEYAGAYDIINNQFYYKLYGIMRAVNRVMLRLRKQK